jgi:hypothetical protein
MFMKGPTISMMLFTQVAPGDYLVQTEIIVVHQGALALMPGGFEFYPSCRQIRVGSSQADTTNQYILFLGTHNDNEPSIYNSVVYIPK